jgi:ubiquinone/menaquinone biosynthesis C-methylase UbiE
MRRIAEIKRPSRRIRYLEGSAEHLPVTDERFDLAWMSMVIHHVEDRKACAAEAARVLDPNGLAVVRNSFHGRLAGFEFYEYFTGSRELDDARLPSIEQVREDFASAGFSFVAVDSVRQVFAADFRSFAEKMRNRGCSSLRLLSDGEFRKGLARIDEIVKSGGRSGPMTESIDMLIFRKT